MVARLSLYQHHPIITTVFSVLIILVSTSYGDDDKDYTDCDKPFSCGLLPELSYPFWGGDRPEVCGHKGFKLKCEEGQLPIIASDTLEFRLLNLKQSSRLMALQLVNFEEYICPTQIRTNSSSGSDIHIFGYDLSLQNLNLLYNCSMSSSTVNRISFCNGYTGSSFYGNDDILANSSGLDSFGELLVGDRPELEEVLGEGYNVSYEYDQGPSICERDVWLQEEYVELT
uniref:Wall-associated receptor kinase galacturonan-binding domain-containing protein n=1 Tax=Populus trichocarpa TaxID=3694 RepID=A0A2K1XHY1_POPTR